MMSALDVLDFLLGPLFLTAFFFIDKLVRCIIAISLFEAAYVAEVIRGGSIGFAESYMRGEFETENLSNLIELTARNIEVIHKF